MNFNSHPEKHNKFKSQQDLNAEKSLLTPDLEEVSPASAGHGCEFQNGTHSATCTRAVTFPKLFVSIDRSPGESNFARARSHSFLTLVHY